MKKKLLAAMMLVMGCATLWGANVADAKSKVTYTIKKGVLTVKGKGAMPKSMKFNKMKKAKKVKKIVVKKGITSIGVDAFRDLPKVKTITVANSVKKIGRAAFKRCKSLKTLTIPGKFQITGIAPLAIDKDSKEKTIILNTKLDTEILEYINSENIKVMKNDPKYVSIDGVVYTKKDKKIIKIPSYRKKVVIPEGTETLYLGELTGFESKALFYGEPRENILPNLKTIVLPASLKKFEASWDSVYLNNVKTVIIKSNQLSLDSYYQLEKGFECITWDVLQKRFAGYILKKDNMYYTKDGVLLGVSDKEITTFTVPSFIKVIEDHIFEGFENLNSVVLPEGLVKIGTHAFSGCYSLKDISIPSTVTTIGDFAFSPTNIKELTIPANVKTVGVQISSAEIIYVEGDSSNYNPKFANGVRTVKYKSRGNS